MAKHNVFFELPNRELGKVDAGFFIYQDGDKLGEITISKGAIEYYPASKQKPVKLSWRRFDRLMSSLRK